MKTTLKYLSQFIKATETKNIVFILGLSYCLISSTLTAQEYASTLKTDRNYKNAIGIRLGGTSGLTYNHKFTERNSIKFILGGFPTFGLIYPE